MTKEEFLARLKEDSFIDKPEEMIQYRLPVVQYYFTHYLKGNFEIQRSYSMDELPLVSHAFERIKEKVLKEGPEVKPNT